MRALLAFVRRLAGAVRDGGRDREFGEELESHLQLHVDDNLRAGMTPDEARRQALIRLGGVDQTKELYRERRGLPALDSAVKDVRFALRLLRRNPGFTGTVLVTLAVGIGGNAMMFSVANTVLLRPLPYADPSQLVSVQTVQAADRSPYGTAPPDFYGYRAQNRSLSGLDAFYTRSFNLTGGVQPERVPALIASSGFFSTLGVPPALGRGFVREDEQWGAHRVAVVTDALWRTRFAADPAVVGRQMLMNGEPYEIVGVLPPAFSFLGIDLQLVVPMSFAPGDNLNSRSNNFLRMIARLRPGMSHAQAAADLTAIAEAIGDASIVEGAAIEVAPLHEALVGSVRRPVLVLLGAVGFVLLIACANLANLLLARALTRQREIAVRLAVGATRGRLLRQFLLESLLLSTAGGVLGLLLAYASADALNLLSMRVLPRAEPIRVDPAVLAFTFGISMLTGIILGLAPALQGAAVDVVDGLKEAARGASDSKGRHRLRAALVVAEVALSLVLLAGAGLMLKSMYQLLRVETGFQADGVLTVQISLPAEKYVDERLHRRFDPAAYVKAVAFFDELIAATRNVPGVQAVGAINGLPLMGEIWGKNVTFFDRPLPDDISGLPQIQYRVVAGDYFRALGIRVLNGRAFSERDTIDAPKVAIINRELARRHYGGTGPIGKILSVNPPLALLPKALIEEARRDGTLPDDYEPARLTVVGVVDDVLYGGMTRSALPLVYTPYSQGSEGTTSMFLVARTPGDPLALAGPIRARVSDIDPDQPVANIQTMNARVSASVAQPRLQMMVLGVFAAVAALLAAVGLYGVMSFVVMQREHEIGIRLALGAARRQVVASVLRQGFTMVAAGVVLGLAAAALVTRVLRSLLFGVSTTDPVVFALIVGVVIVSAGVATYLPARRAARLEPLTALRAD